MGFIQGEEKERAREAWRWAPGKAKVRTSMTASENLEEMDLIRVVKAFWEMVGSKIKQMEQKLINHTEELRIDTVEKWKTFKVLE